MKNIHPKMLLFRFFWDVFNTLCKFFSPISQFSNAQLLPHCKRVIPYKSTVKNMTFFFWNFDQKRFFFNFINKKTFFLKPNFGYFRPLLEFVKDFFFLKFLEMQS